jgi:hypothetical protein
MTAKVLYDKRGEVARAVIHSRGRLPKVRLDGFGLTILMFLP